MIKVAPDSVQFDQAYQLILEASEWLKERGMSQWEKPPVSKAEFRAASDRNEVYVLAQGTDVVGTVTLTKDKDYYWGAAEGDAIYLHRLVVSRKYKGLRIGEQLLRWAEEFTVANDLRLLRLDCRNSNPAIKEYYSKNGFTFKGIGLGKFEFALFEKDLTV